MKTADIRMDDAMDSLEREFYSYDIVQLIQVVKEILGDDDGNDDGGAGRIFFEADPSLAFPPSDVGFVKISQNGNDDNGYDGGDDGCTVRLPVMNLLGSSSPLPVEFSDYISRGRPDADMYRRFLSIAQNRLHALWLDAHLKHMPWSDTGRVAKMVFESMTALSAEQAGFYDGALAQFGSLSRRTRSASDLKLLLESTWKDIRARVEENVGRWTAVDNRRALGGRLRLGQGTTVGEKIFDRTTKFRISLGPLGYHMYKTFLPGESNHQLLRKIISIYLNEPLICELEISCKQSELIPARIGGARDGSVGRTLTLGGLSEEKKEKAHCYRVVINDDG